MRLKVLILFCLAFSSITATSFDGGKNLDWLSFSHLEIYSDSSGSTCLDSVGSTYFNDRTESSQSKKSSIPQIHRPNDIFAVTSLCVFGDFIFTHRIIQFNLDYYLNHNFDNSRSQNAFLDILFRVIISTKAP